MSKERGDFCQYVGKDDRCSLAQDPEDFGRGEGYVPMGVHKSSEDLCNLAKRGFKRKSWDDEFKGELMELEVECTDYMPFGWRVVRVRVN